MSDAKLRTVLIVMAIGVVFLGLLLAWRFVLPVNIDVVSIVKGVPLQVEPMPARIQARPGEMVRVYFRIENVDAAGQPVRATGHVEVLPASASSQIELFNSQCGGTLTYLPGPEQEFAVTFRVQPLGLLDSRHMTLRHLFYQPN